ncbi:MAG TPA: MATE family efflux transporter [candidate division Zixibacteria bacterium]|nr:MATE family efflux transporter [candidate division Zixibacteria bacterium]
MRSNGNHILAEEDVGKLLRKLSVPATVGMFVMSTFNIVDTIFVGHGVGTFGIAGVALNFPVLILVLAIGQLFGMGGASIISRAIGADDLSKVNRTFGNVVLCTTAFAVMLSIPGLIFLDKFVMILGATEEVFPHARDYLQVVLFGTIFRSFIILANNIIRAEGHAKVSMTVMIISAVLNIILDAIFIFVFKMGVRGAAIATLISHFTASMYAVSFFLSGKSTIRFQNIDLRPDWKIIREIVSIGMASLGRNISSSALVMIVNNVFSGMSFPLGIAIYGIINRTLFMFLTPIMGITQGIQPVVGYNFGAKRYPKINEVVKIAYIRALTINTLIFAVLLIFPNYIFSAFTKDPELIEHGVPALRIMAMVFPIVGAQLIGAAVFQAMGKAVKAFVLTMTRQAIFLIPLILIGSKLYGTDGVFWSFPISDLLSAVVTVLFVRTTLKALSNMPPEDFGDPI